MGSKRSVLLILLGFAIVLGAWNAQKEALKLDYPKSWPAPVYDFSKNPLTAEGIELGRKLFYDPILSRDSIISCASCHLSFTAFTHVDHALSHGIEDRIGTRNSLALMNLAWSSSFMWDGVANHLDMQALAPITDSTEMDSDFAEVVEKIDRSADYRQRFKEAFGADRPTGEYVLKALAQFQLTFISANSKYDKVMRNEEGFEFSVQEANGYELFKSNCGSCHREPLFTSGEFANNGLALDPYLQDIGRQKVSLNEADRQKFKIPTLRNIEFSQPYMHDGRYKSLSAVLEHYQHSITDSPTLAPELENGIRLSAEEKVDLIAFLLCLSDKEFLFNPKLSFPRD